MTTPLPFWHQPLVHFLLIGAGLFALDRVITGPSDDTVQVIEITAAQQARIDTRFEMIWQRSPTKAERDAALEDLVRAEILSRRAAVLGLAEGDAVIRDHLRQKMEHVMRSDLMPPDPGDAVLQAYLDTHAARYQTPARMTLEQVFLGRDPDRRAAEQVIAALNAGETPPVLASQSLLPNRFDDVSPHDIARSFGRDFARVADAQGSGWGGPVQSAFGWHAVRVSGRQAPRQPPLAEIRGAVLSDWQGEMARRAVEAAYDDLRDGYVIRIAEPRE